MACEAPAVRCNDQSLNSPTVQTRIWRQFLCRILLDLDPGTDCSEEVLLAAAEPWLCQGSPAKLRLDQVQQICESDLDIDCSAQDCLTPLQEQAIISYLVCQIIENL